MTEIWTKTGQWFSGKKWKVAGESQKLTTLSIVATKKHKKQNITNQTTLAAAKSWLFNENKSETHPEIHIKNKTKNKLKNIKNKRKTPSFDGE